jgi:hypothetical protein
MLEDFEISLVIFSIFFTPIVCVICYKSINNYRNIKKYKLEHLLKLNELKFRSVDYTDITILETENKDSEKDIEKDSEDYDI